MDDRGYLSDLDFNAAWSVWTWVLWTALVWSVSVWTALVWTFVVSLADSNLERDDVFTVRADTLEPVTYLVTVNLWANVSAVDFEAVFDIAQLTC